MRDDFYTIGQLATAAEVPISTVRYYERRGLLQPSDRSAGNYRLYSASGLHRLRFIRTAQEIGFTLEDIALLLGLRDGEDRACTHVRDVILERLDRIREQIHELQRLERVLSKTVQWCENPRPGGRCQVLDELERHAERARPRPRRRSTRRRPTNRA